MIVFDDYGFVQLMMNGEAPKSMFQNRVLTSCARLVKAEKYTFDEMLESINKYMRFEVPADLFEEYCDTRTYIPPVTPHSVTFYDNEIKSISILPLINERKIYLTQLFLFKYFETKRLRVSHREVKKFAHINPNHHPLTELRIGRGIHMRREKYGHKLKEYGNHKPYMYYYPMAKPDVPVFQYMYKGDPVLLPSAPYTNNYDELWEQFLQASKDCGYSKDGKGRRKKHKTV